MMGGGLFDSLRLDEGIGVDGLLLVVGVGFGNRLKQVFPVLRDEYMQAVFLKFY
jgi:hypothetical protein